MQKKTSENVFQNKRRKTISGKESNKENSSRERLKFSKENNNLSEEDLVHEEKTSKRFGQEGFVA